MNWRNELLTAGQDLLNSPKLATATYTTTVGIGLASWVDLLHGFLSGTAVASGIVATLLLGRVHWIKYKNEIVRNKILTKTAAEMGVSIDSVLEAEDE